MPFNLLKFSKTYQNVSRVRQIINIFLKHGFGRVIDQLHLSRFIPFRKRIRTIDQWRSLRDPAVAEALRLSFEELGPTFIKLAQILSSRPDLVTKHFANEFRKLQDRVPPFPTEEALLIIEKETGIPIEHIFSHIESVPVAAASIAQVYHATLLDGSDVVVKVQRPNIREQIETDISILSAVAGLLEKYVTESVFFNPKGIVDEFSRTVKKELDFILEAKNAMRFKANLSSMEGVYIPTVYADFTTEKILIMERIKGVRIDNIPAIVDMGLDRKKLARTGVDSFFKQVLDDGFFHADPHPGNIYVMKDGRLAFMDFGIVGRVTDELRETMASTLLALIHRDFNSLIDQYIEMGLVPEHVDLDQFRKEFKADLTDFLEPLYGLTLQEINFAEYLETVSYLAIKHKMKVPSDLLLVNKAMLILENIGRELDPEFDFIAASEPYASKLVKERFSPSSVFKRARKNFMEASDFVILFPRQIQQILRKTLKDDLHLRITPIGLERFISNMDRSSNRLAFALIISSILLSSAIMHAAGTGPRIYGLSVLGFFAFGVAFLLGIWLIISIIRSGRL